MKPKTMGWVWVMTLAVMALLPQRVGAAAGACTCARFCDWMSMGCRVTPGTLGAGAMNAGGNQAYCPDCPPPSGIPRWHVEEPYLNLFITDEPLSYRMSSGQQMVFRMQYKQRFQMPQPNDVPELYVDPSGTGAPRVGWANLFEQPRIQGMTNAGWSHNWMMSIMFWDPIWEEGYDSIYPVFSQGYEAIVFRPEGGINYFYNTNTFTTNFQSVLTDPLRVVSLVPRSGSVAPTMSTGAGLDGNNILWDEPGTGFKLVYPDGSQDIFGYASFALPTPHKPVSPSPFGQNDTTARALLTQRIDPQGRATLIGYEESPPSSNRILRIRYVVDPDGRTNTFTYDDSSPAAPYALSKIRDPYGRTAQISYGGDGILNGITDAVTNTTTFTHPDSSGWIDSMVTPYGTNLFYYYQVPDPSVTNGFQQRATYVLQPDGGAEFFCYLHDTNQVPASATAPTVPGQVFDDGTSGGPHHALVYRNTFHWDPRQFAALSANVLRNFTSYVFPSPSLGGAIYSLTTNDLQKADMKHWRLGSDLVSVTESLSSERLPSPDAGGTIEGARLWYNYATNQDNYATPEVAGGAQVTCFAQVLPDGSSRYELCDYFTNTAAPWSARPVDTRASVTLPDGTLGELTNRFNWATNGADLLGITNSLGQYVNLGYNTNHQVTALSDALGQVSHVGYDAVTHHLKALTNVAGSTATFSYYVSNSAPQSGGNMLSNIVWSPTGLSLTFTWTNGLPRVVHVAGNNQPDLWVTNGWDGLNRKIGVTFTDGTSISNVFDRIHLGATKDRLGHWSYLGYDSMEHVIAATNANGAVTTYSWCGCGALTAIMDALTNTTSFFYNNQGLLTNVLFADGSSVTRAYDSARRLIQTADGNGRSLIAGYNNQGLLTVVSNTQGALERMLYDAAGRPIQVTDAGNVTITNIFDALNRPLAQIWPDGVGELYLWATNGLIASTNRNGRVTRFARDNAGRLTAVTNANLESVLLGYNSLGQVTDLWDGRTNHTVWHRNQYGWVTNKLDALGREVFRRSYDAKGQVTTNRTLQFGDTAYGYDAVGNLLSIAYPNQTITYTYNALNELRTMADAVGTTIFSNTPTGNLLSEDGPWSGDTVAYGYTDGLRTSMSVGSQGFGYGYDSAWRMYTITSPSGTFNYGYESARPTFLSTIGLPNNAYVTNHYDSLARWDYTALANSWGHVLDGEGYQYDMLGLKTNITRNLGLTTTSVSVGYDNIGQITSWSAKEAGGVLRLNEQQGWAFDKSDNLLFRTNGALVQTFNSDAVNELTNITRAGTMTLSGNTLAPAIGVTVNGLTAQTNGDFTFAATNLTLANNTNSFTNIAANAYGNRSTNILTLNLPASPVLRYDLNGNLTNDGSRSFVYNAENQLTNIVVTNAATTASTKTEFVYDGLGRRRIARDYAWTGAWSKTNETRFIYDGYQLVQERDTNNNVLVTYTRGLDLSGSLASAGGIGGLLARTDTNGSTYYHADGSGNVTALIDGQQTMAARYMYGAFGSLIGKWGAKADANTMQFSSMPRHAQSGLSLYAMRAYDPNLQRWLNQDPQAEAGGLNLYGFVGNSSLGSVDPLGMGVLADLGDIGAGFVNAIERFDDDPNWFSHLGDSLVGPAGALMNADAAFQGAVNANQQLSDMGFANKQDYLLNGRNLNCTVTAGNMDGIRTAALAAGALGGAYAAVMSMITGGLEGAAEEMALDGALEMEAIEGVEAVEKTVDLYRAVGVREFSDVMANKAFQAGGNSMSARQFGLTLEEALKFADADPSKVAILKATVPESILPKLDFSKTIDPFIFKNGVITVHPEVQPLFNQSLKAIEHVF